MLLQATGTALVMHLLAAASVYATGQCTKRHLLTISGFVRGQDGWMSICVADERNKSGDTGYFCEGKAKPLAQWTRGALTINAPCQALPKHAKYVACYSDEYFDLVDCYSLTCTEECQVPDKIDRPTQVRFFAHT